MLEDPGSSSGVYTIEIDREWWRRTAPYVRAVSILLKTLTPVGLAGLKVDLPEATWTALEDRLELVESSITAASEFGATANDDDAAAVVVTRGPDLAEGAVLRDLHRILRDQDPTFADLRKVHDDRRRLLWVHRQFLRHYR
jgi:hypothetical protein